MSAIKKHIKEALQFPSINNSIVKVPDTFVMSYVNSIVVGSNNTFEYNIKVNPDAESEVAVTEKELYEPLYHPRKRIIDNSKSITIAEFEISYLEAKAYVNKIGRKARKDKWVENAKVKIVMDI